MLLSITISPTHKVFLLLKHAKWTPASGSLHLLFPHHEMLFLPDTHMLSYMLGRLPHPALWAAGSVLQEPPQPAVHQAYLCGTEKERPQPDFPGSLTTDAPSPHTGVCASHHWHHDQSQTWKLLAQAQL